MKDIMDYVAASATGGDFHKPLEELLDAYSRMGYRNFEVYTSGRASHFDIEKGPAYYLELGKKYNLKFTSLHLSPVKPDDPESLELAARQAAFAEAVGARVVVFKARTKEDYIQAAGPFLKLIEGRKVTPVIQFHEGGAFNTLQDVIDVIEGINDERIKLQHEVGSLHAAGITWKQFCDAFDGRIALVHVKDMIGAQSVPFGTGEVDIPALFEHMLSTDYTGNFVVEIDPKDKENTRQYISQAVEYLKRHCPL